MDCTVSTGAAAMMAVRVLLVSGRGWGVGVWWRGAGVGGNLVPRTQKDRATFINQPAEKSRKKKIMKKRKG